LASFSSPNVTPVTALPLSIFFLHAIHISRLDQLHNAAGDHSRMKSQDHFFSAKADKIAAGIAPIPIWIQSAIADQLRHMAGQFPEPYR
jgi:hypothetical protein